MSKGSSVSGRFKVTNARRAAWALGAAFVISVPVYLCAHIAGPDPRHTAAPGDDPLACATAGCHTGLPKGGPLPYPGNGAVTATFSSGTTYTPGGGPITITVAVSDPVNTHYGFQMTARLESDLTNAQAGNFTATAGEIVLCDNGQVKGNSGCPANSQVQFIEHSRAPFQASTTPYTFTWTPPATNVGPVHFYVAGNAVNNDNQPDAGDHVYTAQYVLQPLVVSVCTNTAIPVITSIHSLSGFGDFPTFAAGSWLEIKGSGLSDPADPRPGGLWAQADFNGANAPTNLDGISVSIDGKPAFVEYISPTQVNVQAPADTTTGSVAVTITNCNATSTVFNVTKANLVPGMLAPPSFNVGGKQYLVALFPDQVTYVGNANLVPGVPFRPAKPSDVISAYGIGFGDVTPAFPPGVVVNAGNKLTNSLAISFGSTPAAAINYLGLVQSLTGLYQFSIVVPNVPDGDYPINITVGGVTVQQTLFVTVHH